MPVGQRQAEDPSYVKHNLMTSIMNYGRLESPFSLEYSVNFYDIASKQTDVYPNTTLFLRSIKVSCRRYCMAVRELVSTEVLSLSLHAKAIKAGLIRLIIIQ